MIRISVFIVSYNQEQYIAQAIESVINQNVLPYEVIISDDCSTDDTWNIIQRYADKYPQLIKANRNNPNLGIFENFNLATRKTSGNLITCVAGDDYIEPGYFNAVEEFIKENDLDPDNDSFILIPNIINLYENGYQAKYDNLPFKDKNILKLRLRGLIDDRYGIVSRKSLDSTGDFITGIGIHSDFVWGIDRYLHTDKVCFMGGYYSVYRQGVGVVSRTREEEASKSLIKATHIVLEKFELRFDKRDLSFLHYLEKKNEYLLEKSFSNYCSIAKHTILNIGNFGLLRKEMKALAFILLPNKIKKVLFKVKYIKDLSK